MRLLLALLALALLAGCAETPIAYQERKAREMRAAQLVPAAAPRREVRTARVRIHADPAYQQQVLRWRERARAQVERASVLTAAWFGVRLQVVDVVPWQGAGGSDRLADVLAALEAHDRGTDVDWVIGFTGALPTVTASLHELGMARPLSRHFVLRAMDDAAESAALDATFDLIGEGEKAGLYRQRKQHKETVVLLHEWAHTLGAVHVRGREDDLLDPLYAPERTEIGGTNRKLIELGLAHRPNFGKAWHEALEAILERPAPDLDAEALAELRRASVGETQQFFVPLAPDDAATYNEARRLVGEAKWSQAWSVLAPLAYAAPTHPQVQLLACHVALRASTVAEEVCGRAVAAAPADPDPWLVLAEGRMEKGDRAGAAQALEQARLALGEREQQQAWTSLAVQYMRLDEVSRAEAAAARAGEGPAPAEVRRWSLATRRQLGLTPGTVSAAEEATYVAAVRDALQLAAARKLREAEAAVREGLARYPKAPGFLVVRCDLALRRGNLAAARARCDEALAAWDEMPWAHFLAAHLNRGPARAEQHLRRAIELEPEGEHAWRELARIYQLQRKAEALADLQQRFRDRFGRELQLPGGS